MSLKDRFGGHTPNTMPPGSYEAILEAAIQNGLSKNQLEERLQLLDNHNAMFLEDDDDLDDVKLTEDGINYLIGVTSKPGEMTTSSDIGNAVVTARGPGGRVRKG